MTTKRKIIVTSALPYANAELHLGHILEAVQTDIWVRLQKSLGNECHYFCADDTHGTPVMLKAEELGTTPEKLINSIQIDHINTYKKSYGKTLIVGGADGYLGAVLISGFAALRSGSRYVEVFSTDTNHSLIPLHRPELMTSYDIKKLDHKFNTCLLYTSPSPRD